MKDLESLSKGKMDMNFRGGIYSIFNKKTGECYIGSTLCFHKRFIKHISAISTGKASIKLLMAINKFGLKSFKFIVLEIVKDENNLQRKENNWVSKVNPAYNHQKRTRRYALTDRRNRKISRTLQKVIKRGEDSPNYGVKRPEDVVKRIFATRAKRIDQIYANSGKRVVQVDLNGKIIGEFRSVNLASQKTGVARIKITSICKGAWPYNNSDKFTFRYGIDQ